MDYRNPQIYRIPLSLRVTVHVRQNALMAALCAGVLKGRLVTVGLGRGEVREKQRKRDYGRGIGWSGDRNDGLELRLTVLKERSDREEAAMLDTVESVCDTCLLVETPLIWALLSMMF